MFLGLPFLVGIHVATDVYLCSGNQINVSGHRAAKRLNGIWPANVSPSGISDVYVDEEESMDTQHMFIRLRCDRQAAAAWSDSFVVRWKRKCSTLLSYPDYYVATRQTKSHDIETYKSTPLWWNPYDLESVDALETCRWQKNSHRLAIDCSINISRISFRLDDMDWAAVGHH